MQEFIDFVHYLLEDRKITPEEELSLNKICELEGKLTTSFSKDQIKQYNELENEKGRLQSIETDLIIKFAYKLCKKLFK